MPHCFSNALLRVAVVVFIFTAVCGYCAAAEHGDGNPAERLNPITFRGWNFRGDLAIWTAVVFLIVLAVLWKFAWGPIAKALDTRERNVAEQISAAEEANRQAKLLLEEHQRKLAAAGDEVRGILEQGRRQSEQLGRELIDKAKAEAQQHQQRVMQQVDAAADAALRELADRGAQLAVELAGKIVGARLNPADHARLVEQTVEGFMRDEG
jgi:F-type H+-transporting ATPase subunit b